MNQQNSCFPLYPLSRTPHLDLNLFKSPTSDYRSAPFWSWNSRLEIGQLQRQIDCFKDMGFGGYHMHPRTGLDTVYLSDEYMQILRECVRYGIKQGMLSWLYDEDRWPSGYAGGFATSDPKNRIQHLLFTNTVYCGKTTEPSNSSVQIGGRFENGILLAKYDVALKDGYLSDYRLLDNGEQPKGEVWYAYLETALPVPWFNNQAYLNVMDPAAVAGFIEITHERYKDYLGSDFGRHIPSIFSDEPQFVHKHHFYSPDSKADLTLPFCSDFFDTYEAAYNEPLTPYLPEVLWELPDDKVSVHRYRYHDHVTERFVSAYIDQIGAWCNEHGIAFTGHMMEEPSLQSQTAAIGEAMRAYRGFQIPGIDMLCDKFEYSTAKQAQSSAHQYGCPGVLSELYGVTDWDFTFTGHKGQGDWQAALGVTVRVHHLAWLSMAGEAKRDYPASISYQSPWYKEYSLIEDHFARLNTVLTRGRPHVRIGVIHPIESMWLCYGPLSQTQVQREELETSFQNTIAWLLNNQLDFDFICESELPHLSDADQKDKFHVGCMHYETVLVPSLRTIRSTTLERLESFAASGGSIVFAGEAPVLTDALPADRALKLAERCKRIPMTQRCVVDTLQQYRDIEVLDERGVRVKTILYQMRFDGDTRYLFLCNTDRERGYSGSAIHIAGSWNVRLMDTMDGEITEQSATLKDDQTVIPWDIPACGSILLELTPGVPASISVKPRITRREIARLADPVKVTLSEPNVLLMSQAEWRIDNGAWQPREEILRIDNAVTSHFGLPSKQGRMAQPWAQTGSLEPAGVVSLRFGITCDTSVSSPLLAIEQPENVRILLDGVEIPVSVTGWYVDEAIKTVPLPSLTQGQHELILERPYSRKSNLEWCYILGNFGVQVMGRHTRITSPVDTLAFGDWTRQGLPFYTGNVTYHTEIQLEKGVYEIAAPCHQGVLISVDCDGKPTGKIAFPPYCLNLGQLDSGSHKLHLTLYGHRSNGFGYVHNTVAKVYWPGPGAWRSEGTEWGFEYNLRSMGITSAPILYQVVDL